MLIEKIHSIDELDLFPLIDESLREGHKFVQRLVNEFIDGSNRFEKPGESLFIAKVNKEIVGIGGLNIDPYLSLQDVGRVRHLYVLPSYRGSGIGKRLLSTIIAEAKNQYRMVTLYTVNPIADQLYQSFEFRKVTDIYKASHVLVFNNP